MFKKATLKLTALYLGIIMLISLAFSFGLYRISVDELDRGLRGQSQAIMNGPRFSLLFDNPRQVEINREAELAQSRRNLVWHLVFINIGILVGGGFISYYLARRSLKPIEEAHHSMSRFTADASHELRTPLAAIQTETEVTLMDPNLTLADAKKQLTSNLEETAKLTGLTEGLLKLSRLENNHLEKTELNLKDVVKEAVKRAETSASKKSITIKTKLVDKAVISAERSSLEEALLTILDNAVKYSPKESTINIKLTKQQKHAIISVKDQGIGISQTDLEHIFERFYQADVARSKTNIGGYGLGLAIAKNIVDLHGGEINATSQLQKGSIFTIRLPLT